MLLDKKLGGGGLKSKRVAHLTDDILFALEKMACPIYTQVRRYLDNLYVRWWIWCNLGFAKLLSSENIYLFCYGHLLFIF